MPFPARSEVLDEIHEIQARVAQAGHQPLLSARQHFNDRGRRVGDIPERWRVAEFELRRCDYDAWVANLRDDCTALDVASAAFHVFGSWEPLPKALRKEPRELVAAWTSTREMMVG